MHRRLVAPLIAVVLFAAGCSKEKPDCQGAATVCGDTCTNLRSDNENCGACGNACGAGRVCSNAACAVNCAAGLVNCGGDCVDPLTDRMFCGASDTCVNPNGGAVCGDGQVCSNSTCALTCQPGLIDCDGTCIDPTSDRNHCGATGSCLNAEAGAVCGSGQVCANRACATSCPEGQVDCGGRCVDPKRDRAFCGVDAACTGGEVCGDGKVCSNGTCLQSCPPGQQPCGGLCVDTSSDPNFCGADSLCGGGSACGPSATCYQGRCWSLCEPGWVVCAGSCIDPLRNPNFCGASGYCTGLAAGAVCGAGESCAAGACLAGPAPNCATAGGACGTNADCCSYACEGGFCVPNTVEGGICQTSADCSGMICKSSQCSAAATCRDDADVCTSSVQCCSHHCNGAACVPDSAPVVQMGDAVQTVPRNQPFTLVNTSYDPDAGDTLSYGWTITPITGGWTISANNVKNPVFNPGANTGTYTATLDVTDNWGLTRSGSVTLAVVNTPPVVTPAVAAATTPRNLALNVAMTVSDANGDTLACTWSICRQGTATCLTAPAALTGLAGLPASSQGAAFPTGLVGTQEGDWDVALACSDGYLTTTGRTTVTVANTPPSITVPATRTFNLGADAASTPNASITAIASDQNGDSIASWTWTVVSVPGTSAVTTSSLGGSAATDTAIFKPDATGQYTLTVRACDPDAMNPPYVDRPSPSDASCSTSTVVATVYPWIRPLGHSVADAAFYKSAVVARLVVVGADGASTGALWDYDLVAGTSPVKTALPGPANAVTLTPDGGTALVGDDVNVHRVTLGTSPTVTSWTSPIPVGDVIALGSTDAFVFPRINVGSTYYQRFNVATGTFSSAYQYGAWGAYVAGSSDNWFVANTASNYLYRMSLSGQNLNLDSSRSGYTGGKVWSAANGAHVFAADGTIYAVPATPVATLTPLATTLGLTNLRSVDTSSGEEVVLAVQTGASFVARYSSTFTPMVPEVLPHWGTLGNDRVLTPLFAFVSSDGTKAYVLVRTTSSPDEYGLYTYALP